LVKIAASDSHFAVDARTVLEEWRNGIARRTAITDNEEG
jgi:hypothetical protein